MQRGGGKGERRRKRGGSEEYRRLNTWGKGEREKRWQNTGKMEGKRGRGQEMEKGE